MAEDEVTLVPIDKDLLLRLRKIIEDDNVFPILHLSDRSLVEAAIEMKLAELEW